MRKNRWIFPVLILGIVISNFAAILLLAEISKPPEPKKEIQPLKEDTLTLRLRSSVIVTNNAMCMDFKKAGAVWELTRIN